MPPVRPFVTTIGRVLFRALAISACLVTVGFWLASLATAGSGSAEVVAYKEASATPSAGNTPRPDDSNSVDGESSGGQRDATSEDNSGEQWTIAVVSGLAGALLGVLGERAWGAHLERKSLKTLLKYVAEEVRVIEGIAKTRRARTQSGAFSFDAPIATSAWQLAMSSEVGWRLVLKDELFAKLRTLYDDVDAANHQRNVAVEMFTLSQNAEPEEALFYLGQARDLNFVPYEETEKRAQEVTSELAKRGWRS